MRRALALVWLLALLPAIAAAQAYTTITAVNVPVDNGSGTAVNPPSGSQLCFLGVNNAGAAITYTPSGGSPVSGTVCGTLNGTGGLTGSLLVANPATASPPGLLYTITVINGLTTYLTIPTVGTVTGSVWSYDAYGLPGTGVSVGIGKPHLTCAGGAQWTSTTLPPGQNAAVCNTAGSWQMYPPAPYCPSGQAYLIPQPGGAPFCLPAVLSGNGAPSGTCTQNSTYSQQDGGGFYVCKSAAWVLVGSGGGASPGGSTGAIQYNNGGAFGGANLAGIVKGTGSGAPTTANGTDVNTLLQALTGCSTAGYILSPQSSDCVPNSAGSLPTASYPGQEIISQSAGATYVILANQFQAQTSDTIATLNTKCAAGEATLFINTTVTDTITANTSLNSNCWVVFGAAGELNITSSGGSYTLTIPNAVVGTSTQHLAGSASYVFGTGTRITPEWCGAVGNYVWGTGGTDDHTAIQTCGNYLKASTVAGATVEYHLDKLFYIGTSTIDLTGTSYFKLTGENQGDGYGVKQNTGFVTSSLTAAILKFGGTGGTCSTGSNFYSQLINFSVARDTGGYTSTSDGILIQYTCGLIATGLHSDDSGYDFHLVAPLAGGVGYFAHNQAGHCYYGITPGSGVMTGWFLDTTPSSIESVRMYWNTHGFNNNGTTCSSLTDPTQAMLVSGTNGVSDVMVDHFESAEDKHILVVTETSTGTYGCADTTFDHLTADGVTDIPVAITGLNSSCKGSLIITNSHLNGNVAAGTGFYGFDCESSEGLKIANNEFIDTGTTASLYWHNCNNSTATGNTFNSTISTNGMEFVGSSHISAAGNTFKGTYTNGVNLDSASANNAVIGNTFGTSVTNQVVDANGDNEWNTDTVHRFPGSIVLAGVATAPSTSPVCPNGTGGALTTTGCSGGGGGGGSGFAGTVTYTSSHTLASGDNGYLVIMNCSSACAVTLPNPQPSTTFIATVQSIGSSTATITLGSSITYNSGSSVPVLLKYDLNPIAADSGTSTNYIGKPPLVAGSNVTLTPAANGLTVASSGGGGGSGNYTALGSYTASSSSVLQMFTRNASGESGNLFQSDFDTYVFEFVRLLPSTNASFYLQGSTDASTCDSTSGHYSYRSWRFVTGASGQGGSTSDTKIIIDGGAASDTVSSTATGGGLNGSFKLYNPLSTAGGQAVVATTTFYNNSSVWEADETGGNYIPGTPAALLGACVSTSTGNITSGVIHVYGVSH